MRPVEHTSTSEAGAAEAVGGELAMRSASRRPGSPVAALALPELSTTAAAAVGEMPAADLHRRRGDEVRGEHAGGGDGRAVDGGDEREVGRARRLDAAAAIPAAEAVGRSDAHGIPLCCSWQSPIAGIL